MVTPLLKYGWILVTLLPLLAAAYYDWKERIIPDKIWLAQLLGGVTMLVIFFTSDTFRYDRIIVIVNILLGFLFALILIFTGAMAGGDIKGFFSISISYPLFVTLIDPAVFPLQEIFPAFFAILLNFFLFYVFLALGFFSYNFIQLVRNRTFSGISGSLSQQIRLLFEGIRVSTEGIERRRFYNPSEVYEEGVWKLHTPKFEGMMTDEEFEEMETKERAEMLTSIEISGKEYIWIRPQIPGITILLGAFILTITLGVPLAGLLTILTSFP